MQPNTKLRDLLKSKKVSEDELSLSPYPLYYSEEVRFHLGLLHIILDERLGIFEAYDDQLE